MHRSVSIWLCVLFAAAPTSPWASYELRSQNQEKQTGRLISNPRSVLTGDKKRVGAIAFSPNGRILATGSEGGNVQLWDVSTEELQAVLPGHRTVADLVFSFDGRTLATLDVSKVRLWDMATKQLKMTATGKTMIGSLSFAPDNRTLATSSFYESKVRLWNVDTGQLKTDFPHEQECRYCGEGVGDVAFSSDGKTLATSGFRRAYLWDLPTNLLRATLIDESGDLSGEYSHGSSIYKISFSPDGQILATASRDGTAKLWNVTNKVLLATLEGHKGRIHRLAFSPSGRTLATGSDDKTVRLWDVATSKLKATLQHRGTVWSIQFSPNSTLVATAADNDHSAKLWDAKTGELLATLDQASSPLAFSPDGRTLATGSRRNSALLWDVPTN